MKYKAICFDIDGTLYDLSRTNRRLFRIGFWHPFIMKRYHSMRARIRQSQDGFCRVIPIKDREAMYYSTGKIDDEAFEDFSKTPMLDKTKAVLDRRFYNPLFRSFHNIKCYDGVRSTFQFIKSTGTKIGVMSDFPLCRRMETMELSDLVDYQTDVYNIGYLKPSNHCFEYLLYNLDLKANGIKAGEVLYVGDSYAKDIIGAVSGGLDAVLINVDDPDRKDEKYPLALQVFRDWNGFDRWIRSCQEV